MDISIAQLIKNNGGIYNNIIANNIDVLLKKRKLITAGETILLLTFIKCEDKIKILLENDINIDTNHKDKLGKTALMYAAEFGYDEIVKILLRFGADINCKDNVGKTALMYAYEFGHYNIVIIFLGYGVDVNCIDNYKNTALSYALNTHDNIVKILIKHNANVNHNCINQLSILELAVKGRCDIYRLLIKCGANTNYVDSDGTSILHMCVGFFAQNSDLYYEKLEILLEHIADINQKNKLGQTALMVAIIYKNSKSVRLLLKYNANVNINDNYGYMALCYATDKFIDILLENNATINNENKDGQTMLISVCQHNISDTYKIRKLLQNGANVDHKDKFGKTAIDYAIEHKNKFIVDLLSSKKYVIDDNFIAIMNSITEHIETCKISENIVASHYDKKIKT